MVHWHFAKTACLGKIWFSSYSPKWLSANEISVFFGHHYFINRLISDFLAKEQCLLTDFLKKILIWANGPFWIQTFRSFWKILLVVFWKKKFVWGNMTFLGHFFFCLIGYGWNWVRPLLLLDPWSGHDFFFHDDYWTVRTWWLRSINSQDMISQVTFMCDRYCMDIMWCLCVQVKIQHRIIECKGAWILKTDILIF